MVWKQGLFLNVFGFMLNVLHIAPVPESQSMIVALADADTICFPSGENATARTSD